MGINFLQDRWRWDNTLRRVRIGTNNPMQLSRLVTTYRSHISIHITKTLSRARRVANPVNFSSLSLIATKIWLLWVYARDPKIWRHWDMGAWLTA